MTDTSASDTTARPLRARLLAIALAVGVVVVSVVVVLRVTGERTVPYEDAQSAGLLTLCSADGEAVTEGAVDDRPFAAFAVGETGLPPEYDSEGTVATLFAYQPRQGIDAGEFSGVPLTAAGLVADPGEPAVAVTEDVWTVSDFTTAFPATFDGYVQLRLILGTPGGGTLTENPYDTADLRVDGDSWELVRGGNASCAEAADLVS
jgi:hypothetical protein